MRWRQARDLVASSRIDDTLRQRLDARVMRGTRQGEAERPAFADYFSAGVCCESDFGSAALRLASRLAASRLPIRRTSVRASTLLVRGCVLACPSCRPTARRRREACRSSRREPKALAMGLQRFAGEWTLRRRLGGSRCRGHLLRCTATNRVARRTSVIDGENLVGAALRACLRQLHVFERGGYANRYLGARIGEETRVRFWNHGSMLNLQNGLLEVHRTTFNGDRPILACCRQARGGLIEGPRVVTRRS